MARRTSMATLKWRKESIKRVEFYLHKELDKDVLEWLQKQPNKREYIIALLRKDMNEHQKPADEKN